MKIPIFTGIVTLGLVALSSASSSYVQNFDAYTTVPGSDVNGQDGWTINNTSDQYSFVYPTLPGYGNGINLGDASAVTMTPSVSSTVTLSHPYAGQMGGITLAFDFAIIDSYAPGFYNRDSFEVSLTSGATTLLGIMFSPVVATPGDPSLDVGAWNVNYISAYGSGTLNLQYFKNNDYLFLLECVPNGANTDFTLTLTGGNALSDTKTLSGLDPASLTDQFNINWANVPGNDFGSNYIALDNLNIVPEPTSSLLLCLAGMGLVSRRKRA